MANAILADIYGAGLTLVPHVEMAAIMWMERMYAMPSRVTKWTDMSGWNVRKWSEYGKYGRAVNLSENTAIPSTSLRRKRKNEIEPYEVGSRYVITDRRASTDLENIIADSVRALGKGMGDRLEADLIDVGVNDFIGGRLGSAATAYTFDLAISGQFAFKQDNRQGRLHHIIHPFQALQVQQTLAQVTGSNAGVNMDFRERAVNSVSVPAFGNLEIVTSMFLPRRVVHRLKLYGTSGTFRLGYQQADTIGTNVTAAISANATHGTVATAVAAALNALTPSLGTWVVTSASLLDITITPPAGVFLDYDSELRLASDLTTPAGITLAGEKSSYDLVGTLTSAPLDIHGASIGVEIGEKSASCRSLMYFDEAIAWDLRSPVKAHFNPGDPVQGRAVEYSAYTVYGVGVYRPELGITIETTANSPFAVP